jgi:tetratricopeptide (TPR) repeat protein
MKVLELYSLFSEYHKNKDYPSALPYGWQVLECDEKKFAKWIYYKMEDALWYLHDSSDIAEEEIQAIEDSIPDFYDKAVENYPSQKGYFLSRKAFVTETWLNGDNENIISLYEQAVAADSNISTYYYDKLGELYKSTDNIAEASNIYSYLSDKEPDNPVWPEKLVNLVEDPGELAKLFKEMWEKDRENPEKAWKYAQALLRENMFAEAVTPLEFLVEKNPESKSYWNQLASAYHKTEQLNKAEDAYKKLVELEPDKREHLMNLGIIAKDKSQFAQARSYYQKASDVGGKWGLPIYYEGLLYETAARNCGFEFEDKLVYQLAVDTYKKAKTMDPSVTQAQDRITALATSVPSQEDYFFRGYKSGQTIQISGDCYGWIGRSVTVP